MNSAQPLRIVHRRITRTDTPAAKRTRKKAFPTRAATMKDLMRAASRTDYATMPKSVRKAMLADLEAHYLRNNEERLPFDPSGLPELARARFPQHPWLAEALEACTTQWRRNELYTYFIDPVKRRAEWAFAGTLFMDCPQRGGLAIDILKDKRIGGIEFLDVVMGRPTSAEAWERALRALASSRAKK